MEAGGNNMKKLSMVLAMIITLTFPVPVLGANADAVSGPTPREVNVIGQYLGSFGKTGEETGIFINLYENNKEVKALIDTYPLPENKSGVASKFIATATIESGGKVKLFGKELLEKKDGAQLINFNFTVINGVAVGEAHYIDKTEMLPMKLVMQNDEHKPSDWAKSNFYSSIAEGLVPLSLQENPKAPIKRGEFAELAVSLLMKVENKSLKELEELSIKEEKSKVTFTDTNNNKYIQIAARLGIVKGYGDGTFLPNAEITREESAVLLEQLIYFVTKGELAVTMQYIIFEDENEISQWAKNSVQLVTKVGAGMGRVMNGVGEGQFDPKGKYTVEQSILTMQRVEQLHKQFN